MFEIEEIIECMHSVFAWLLEKKKKKKRVEMCQKIVSTGGHWCLFNLSPTTARAILLALLNIGESLQYRLPTKRVA